MFGMSPFCEPALAPARQRAGIARAAAAGGSPVFAMYMVWEGKAISAPTRLTRSVTANSSCSWTSRK